MTYDEYAQERDAVVKPHEKNRIHRHVEQRMGERFDLECAYGTWARYSHEAATRHNCEKVGSNYKVVFLLREIKGNRVILVYNRDIKCVVTVLTEGMVSGYIDRQEREHSRQQSDFARKRRLKAGTQKTKRKPPKEC